MDDEQVFIGFANYFIFSVLLLDPSTSHVSPREVGSLSPSLENWIDDEFQQPFVTLIRTTYALCCMQTNARHWFVVFVLFSARRMNPL